MRLTRFLRVAALGVAVAACGDESNNNNDNQNDTLEVPNTYTFESRFVAGESSVSYGGQISRHVLVNALKGYISGLTAGVDGGDFDGYEAGDVVAALNFYYEFHET